MDVNNLIGRTIIHGGYKGFGEGTIVELKGDIISIDFGGKVIKLSIENTIDKMKFNDDETRELMQAVIKEKAAAEEKKRAEEEMARKLEEERKAAEAAVKRAEIAKKHSYSPKPTVRSQREEGQRMTFFVFQGNTFDREYRGGYLWAPKENNSATPPHHWTRLLDVRKGDIILHGCNGYVQAISVAKDSCYECPRPKELEEEELWDLHGRMVDCDYTYIEKPIKTSKYVSDIVRLSKVKYSPFDKYGSGNMGYLFEINRELARIFIEESVKNNPYLASIDYISDFISEDSDD